MFSIHSTAQRRWFRRVHVTFPGAIIEKNSGLQLCHPRIVPILSGAIWCLQSNITITGNEVLRGGFSGFEGKEAGRRRSMFFCFRPTVLSRCVFSPYVPLLPGCIYIWSQPCCGERRQCPHEQQQALNKRCAPPDIHGGVQKPICLLYTSPSPRDGLLSRMPSSA